MQENTEVIIYLDLAAKLNQSQVVSEIIEELPDGHT